MNNELILILALIIGIVIGEYILYENGLQTIRQTRTLKYISYNEKNQIGANVTKCTGTIKRVLPIKTSKEYIFSLKEELKDGIITVDILNSQKQPILYLSKLKPSGIINIEGKQKLYIKVTLENATGKYNITWN